MGNSRRRQIRVFHRVESPEGYPNYMDPYPNAYNWTMTYRRDSDVFVPYGSFVSRTSPKKDNLEGTLTPLMKNKTRLVAWAASHCSTASKRELLVQQLEKHVPIDVYGKCGTLLNFRSPQNCSTGRWAQYQSCYTELGPTYKFYLALENSLCVDYVTEKFYLALANGMVPIVYGGANSDVYKVMAPPGSFINVRDFPTVKALADYLKFLDKNDHEYLKYFEWREKFKLKPFMSPTWCLLCQSLWQVSEVKGNSGERVIRSNYSQIYGNITNWFYMDPFSQRAPDLALQPACVNPPSNLIQNGI